MAKNPEAERQAAAELVTLLLHERQRQLGNGTYAKEIDNHIRGIISHVLLWKHSEAEGEKYKDCRYWSQGALESVRRHGKVVTSRNICGGDALRHEHLFPRKQLINKLFLIHEPTLSEIRETLDRLNVAVIVTIDEDKSLGNAEGDESNPWNRYDKAGVIVERKC